MQKSEISAKIKEDWGTVKFFCKKHDINLHTFKHVLYGHGKSKPITKVLIKYKYIKSEDELVREAV